MINRALRSLRLKQFGFNRKGRREKASDFSPFTEHIIEDTVFYGSAAQFTRFRTKARNAGTSKSSLCPNAV